MLKRGEGVPTPLPLHVLSTSSQPRHIQLGPAKITAGNGRLWSSTRKWYGAPQNLVVFVEVARILFTVQFFSLRFHTDAVWRQEEAWQPFDWQAEQCCQEARNWLLHLPSDAESQQEAWMRFDVFLCCSLSKEGFVKLQDKNDMERCSYPWILWILW